MSTRNSVGPAQSTGNVVGNAGLGVLIHFVLRIFLWRMLFFGLQDVVSWSERQHHELLAV